jgi:hypothetical protein
MLPLFDQPGMTCTDCGKVFDGQPADFLRYNRWADAWVTLAEEDGTVLPDYGVCKDCQDAANDAHALARYGGPNHWQIEQRLMEDERSGAWALERVAAREEQWAAERASEERAEIIAHGGSDGYWLDMPERSEGAR